MPFVRTFDFVRPPARGDGVPFVLARIDEAPDDNGVPDDWSPVGEIGLVTSAYLADRDPSCPRRRTLTTAAATLEEGWYRIVWIDAEGAVAEGAPFSTLKPRAAGVARLLRARTASMSDELGEFTEDTVPTLHQVDGLLRTAAIDVDGRLQRWVPDNFIGRRTQIVELRAAMLVEYSYFADQAADADRSPASAYIALAEAELKALRADLDPPRLA